jgi:hypothetical protein
MSPPKVNNSIVKNFNKSKIDELKRTIIRIVNEIKEDMYKPLKKIQRI